MPVKLTHEGKPLEQSLQQAPQQNVATAGSGAGNVVDQLLKDADNIPEAAPAKQVVATADVGTMGKNGAITVETTEHPRAWLEVPDNYNGPYGKVTYGMAATINTGNFENLRPFVQIEVPFIPGQQEAAYAYAEGWADERISNIINATKAQISGA